MHSCDFKRCVNPVHLSLGTHQENVDATWARGRGRTGVCIGDSNGSRKHPECLARGEDIGTSKLTADIVVTIRERCAAGESQGLLAQEYSVALNAIFMIVKGKTWTHVGGPISTTRLRPTIRKKQLSRRFDKAKLELVHAHIKLGDSYETIGKLIGVPKRAIREIATGRYKPRVE